MKQCLSILRAVIGALVMAVALIFVVLEGTLLLTGDFLLYESPAIAFLQLCLRLLIPAFAFTVALLSLLKRHRRFTFASLCLLASTVATAPVLSNHFGLYFVLLAVLFFIVNLKR